MQENNPCKLCGHLTHIDLPKKGRGRPKKVTVDPDSIDVPPTPKIKVSKKKKSPVVDIQSDSSQSTLSN